MKGLEGLIGDVDFDLVVFAFWQTAERYLPAIRRISPRSRVVVDSVDLQFLRDARGTFCAEVGMLSAEYGANLVGELNVYAAADAVLTVSAKEAEMIRELLGEATLVTPVPDAEDVELSTIPFFGTAGHPLPGQLSAQPERQRRRVSLSQGRSAPASRSCSKSIRSPSSAAGLDDTIRAYGSGNPDVRMVGWVPSVTPYLERARISVVPLLYGAGTKRKLIQSLIGGTPAVSTTVGIEGLDLVDEEQVLVADEEGRFAERDRGASSTTQPLWRRLQRRGRAAVLETHGREAVRARFLEAVAQTLARPAKTGAPGRIERRRLREPHDLPREPEARRADSRALAHEQSFRPRPIAVLSDGSSELLRLRPWRTMHFPVDEAGAYAGRPESVGDAISATRVVSRAGCGLPRRSLRRRTGRACYDALPTFSEELRSRYACVAQSARVHCVRAGHACSPRPRPKPPHASAS